MIVQRGSVVSEASGVDARVRTSMSRSSSAGGLLDCPVAVMYISSLNVASAESTGERLLDADLAVKVKQLELDGVEAAEKGDIAAAEQLFTEVIELAPQRASGYNNRAQARRLLDNVSGKYQQR
jgi:hypothetical protein